MKTNEVMERLFQHHRDYSTVLGNWIWIRFPHRPSKADREHLSKLGFRWSWQKRLWKCRCDK